MCLISSIKRKLGIKGNKIQFMQFIEYTKIVDLHVFTLFFD